MDSPANTYSWDRESGVLKSDSDYVYNIQPRKDNRPVFSKLKEGIEVSYYNFDKKTGVQISRENGREEKKIFHTTRGILYNKLKTVEWTNDEGKLMSKTYMRDNSGAVIRQIDQDGNSISGRQMYQNKINKEWEQKREIERLEELENKRLYHETRRLKTLEAAKKYQEELKAKGK